MSDKFQITYYFEIAVKVEYSGSERHVPETRVEDYDPIKDKVKGIHGAILRYGVNFLDAGRNDLNRRVLEKSIDAADRLEK